MTWKSFAWAISIRVVESFASAASFVWLTNWRVVWSFSAIAMVSKPFVIRCQTVFCVWLRGDVTVNVCLIIGNQPDCLQIVIYLPLFKTLACDAAL